MTGKELIEWIKFAKNLSEDAKNVILGSILVELRLLTGRQHQIRKHAALAKHAIVGDTRYGDVSYNDRMADIYKTDRMFLHAFRLSLPIGGRLQTFETPLPPDFNKLF